jgi:hypothetical protein
MFSFLFTILLVIHGIIHMSCFTATSRIAVRRLSGDSRNGRYFIILLSGLWLVASLLFLAGATLRLLDQDKWWMVIIPAWVISQTLSLMYWPATRYSAIVNLLIVAVTLNGYAEYHFSKEVDKKVMAIFEKATHEKRTVTDSMFYALPYPVKNWLARSGIARHQQVSTVRLRQQVSLRMRPGLNYWLEGDAEEYFTVDKPAFIWNIKTGITPIFPISGCDKFVNGRGIMDIKAFSTFNLVHAAGIKITEGSLQRWLAEICWFPGAALHDDISWQAIDSNSARATLHYGSSSGSVNFLFDKDGNVTECNADRYMENEENSRREKWVVRMMHYSRINGIEIPADCEVTWKLKTGDFTWCKLHITDIAYDKPLVYGQ